jgi:hypothetical protein
VSMLMQPSSPRIKEWAGVQWYRITTEPSSSLAAKVCLVSSTKMAEVVAVRSALAKVRDNGFRKIIMISDCLSLINQISCSVKARSDLGTVVGDIKSLKTDFKSCLFRFSSRRTNVVAHKLARSSEPLLCNLFVGVIPELIWVKLCNDVN